MKIALIGFGTVGQGFVEVLALKKSYLQKNYNLNLQLVSVADIKHGSIVEPDGIEPNKLLQHFRNYGNLSAFPAQIRPENSLLTIEQSDADIVIEATPTNIKNAQPAFDHIRRAFELGKNVVTCNKGPVALYYSELQSFAQKKHLAFKFESTVMSGSPILNTALYSLKGCEFTQIRGIMNGTTNFILTQMEAGHSYSEVLQEAQRLGYTEADPTGDVDGWDTLAKVIILANVVCGGQLKVADVKRRGITELDQNDIQNAIHDGFRWKLIGEVTATADGLRAKVEPQKIPLNHPLASVMGTINAITFNTDLMGEVTITGAGAGSKETAFGILNDIIHIVEQKGESKNF